MEKEDFNKLILATSLISVVAISIGTYIINHSLINYQLMDFDLLKPRAIIVGLLFLFFIAINTALFFIFIDLNDFKTNSYPKILKHTAFKFLFGSIIFMVICNYSEISSGVYYNNLFGYKFNVIMPTIYMMFLYPFLLQFYNDYRNNPEYKKIHFTYKTFNYVMFLFMVLFSLSLIGSSRFTGILYFNFWLYTLIATMCGTVLIRILRSDSAEEPTPSIFSNGKITNNTKFIGALVLTLFLYSALNMTNLYADNIYMNMKQAYGGGKLEKVSYVINQDTISGLKVYETSDYVYLSEPDSSIKKLDWSEVDKILKRTVSNH